MTETAVRRGVPGFLPDPPASLPRLLLFFCLLIQVLPSYVGTYTVDYAPARVISLVMLALLIPRFAAPASGGGGWINPGILLILIYGAIQLVVYAASIGVLDPRQAAKSSYNSLPFELCIIAVYVMTEATTERARRFVLIVTAVGVAYACFVGILQIYSDIDLRVLLKPPGFYEGAQANNAAGSGAANVAFSTRYGGKRAYATFWHPIQLSMAAAVAVPLALHHLRYAKNPRTRVLATSSLILAIFGLIASGSRTGVITLVVALAVFAFAFRGAVVKFGHLLVAGAFVLAMSFALGGSKTTAEGLDTITEAFSKAAAGEEGSAQARLDDISFVQDVLNTHPLLGLGLLFPPQPATDGALDNTWFTAVMYGGLVAVAGWALIGVAGAAGLRSYLRRAKNPQERSQGYVLGGAFFGIYAASFGTDLFACQQTMELMFVVLGLLWASWSPPQGDRSRVGSQLGAPGGVATKPHPS